MPMFFPAEVGSTMLLRAKRARTTSYHPQTNGMVERFHHQLKAALKARPQPDKWMDALPFFLLGIRTTLKEDVSSTACMRRWYTAQLSGNTVSIDRLKPPHLDIDNFYPTSQTAPAHTCSVENMITVCELSFVCTEWRRECTTALYLSET